MIIYTSSFICNLNSKCPLSRLLPHLKQQLFCEPHSFSGDPAVSGCWHRRWSQHGLACRYLDFCEAKCSTPTSASNVSTPTSTEIHLKVEDYFCLWVNTSLPPPPPYYPVQWLIQPERWSSSSSIIVKYSNMFFHLHIHSLNVHQSVFPARFCVCSLSHRADGADRKNRDSSQVLNKTPEELLLPLFPFVNKHLITAIIA